MTRPRSSAKTKARPARAEAELQPRELESSLVGELLSALALGADRATAALAVGLEDLDAQLAADPSLLKRVQQAEAKAELQRIARATLAAQQGDRRAAAWLRERAPTASPTGVEAPGVAPPPVPANARSEGQRLLQAVDASHADIAVAVGATKQAVSYWRRGSKTPDLAKRMRLHELYGIEASAWERPPASGPASTASSPSLPSLPPRSGTETTLQECEAQLAHLHALMSAALVPSERVRLADVYGKQLALKARLEREQELVEDRLVREHPAWKRIRDSLLAALRPWPDAAKAVAQTLERLDA